MEHLTQHEENTLCEYIEADTKAQQGNTHNYGDYHITEIENVILRTNAWEVQAVWTNGDNRFSEFFLLELDEMDAVLNGAQ